MIEVELGGGRVAHDIQYYLDGSIECYDMAPNVYFWLRNIHPDATSLIDGMDKLVELEATRPDGRRDHSGSLNNYGRWLERQYLEWQKTASWEQLALCLGFGVHYSPTVDFFIRQIAHTHVEERTGLFASSNAFSEMVRAERDDLVYYDGMKMFERKISFLVSLKRISDQWEALEVKPDFQQFKIVYPPMPTMVGMDLTEWDEEAQDYIRRKRLIPPPKKHEKKALKRSADLLNGLTGENTVQLFLSGDEVSVTGRKYRFSLTKERYHRLTGAHGAATTRVYCAETNEFIAGLCVYTPNVTVFDHMASIVMHCKAGIEDQIIMDANITTKGNLKLLPKAKIEELSKPKEIEPVDLDGNNAGTRSLFLSMHGSNAPKVTARQLQVKALNDKRTEQTIAKVRKKYGFLFPKRQVRLNAVAALFHPPIPEADDI